MTNYTNAQYEDMAGGPDSSVPMHWKMDFYEKYKEDEAFRKRQKLIHVYEKENGTCYQYKFVKGEDIYIRHNNDGSFTLVS